ncbi:MAG: glycerate kinase [Bacteroidota bacterium]
MNFVIAPDTFKDCLTASEVAQAMEQGVHNLDPNARCFRINASDGGEGFLNAVAQYVSEVKTITIPTVDPLGRPINAAYLFDEANHTAYVELARASGIELLTEDERNPMYTSTFGTGMQLQHAIAKGARKIYLGIGGSATNDGGAGIAKALGFDFFDSNGGAVMPTGQNLASVHSYQRPKDWLGTTRFFAVNDVLNPLFGPNGAAFTYARQKGASEQEIELLDLGLQNLDRVVSASSGKSSANLEGSGAAGGTAFGLKSFLNAEYISGVSFVLELSNFRALLSEHKIDAIITGEGKIDHQTAFGKFIYGISQVAAMNGIPVVAVCGKLDASDSEVKKIGLSGVAQLYDPVQPPAYSFENAARLITQHTESLLRDLLT